jgi:hypothetical protein
MVAQKRAAKSSEAEKPVALALKIDHGTFMRMSLLLPRERTTARDILTQALLAHLKKARV